RLGVLRPDLRHLLDVAAGEERLLGGGEDDALDAALAAVGKLPLELFDGGPDVVLEGLVHRVDGRIRVVHRQRDDAVVGAVPAEHVVGHCVGFSLVSLVSLVGVRFVVVPPPVAIACRTGNWGPRQTRSMMVATPMPPPMHSEMRAKRPPVRCSSSMAAPVIMAPVAPSGWPMAMAPPLTLSFSSGMPSFCWACRT